MGNRNNLLAKFPLPTFKPRARFAVGQLVEDRITGDRGVIFEIDPAFMQSDEWYERRTSGTPPRDTPWYHVLVNNGVQSGYVAQCDLCPAAQLEQIRHPALGDYFSSFDGVRYATVQRSAG